MEHQRELQQIADELRSIAAFGLNFAQNPNDDGLPPLSTGHHLRVPFVFKQLRGETPIPFIDPVAESAGQNPHES